MTAHLSPEDLAHEFAEFMRSLAGAWDCCGTCAGGVMARRDRELQAVAWSEGYDAALEINPHVGFADNPYRPLT